MNPVRIAMPQWGNNFIRLYMKSKYIASLRRSGAKICWVSMTDPRLEEIVRSCDGLLLPGGDDIDPSRYGQTRSEKCGVSSHTRDQAEWRMLEAFLPTNKPILCVCRGMQFLNVFFGGTLHQDIPGHSDFRSRFRGCHDVRLIPGTKTAGLWDSSTIFVNSLHHQAADAIAPGLTVSAVSEDGTVEALELASHPFCIGVQWHPEHLSRKRSDQQALFDVFVNLCREK